MKDSIKVAIAGCTGYIGLQLIKLLQKHPKVKILYLCATKSIGKSINQFDNKITKKKLPRISKIENISWNKVDVLFTALPNGEAHKIAKIIPDKTKLIDLSADFRLDNPKVYKKWYKIKHKSKNLIPKSIYSITEFSRKKLSKYKILSCPGCYPTSIQLPLVPLIKKKLINTNNITVDSKSGYSGAGRKINKKFKFKNLFNSVNAYGVGSHRHMAEIDQELTKVAKKKVQISFTPHLIPMFRGILSTIYIETKNNKNAKNIYNILKKYHKNNFFIKVENFNKPIGTGDVMNTNYCRISVCKNRKKNNVIIISAIDNLIKGGSGQAVQNMNAYYKMNESYGLI
tara:strand:- start:2435 stop:3460 length:1026 start_codon:yes stop_codon:yes gene_type:complete